MKILQRKTRSLFVLLVRSRSVPPGISHLRDMGDRYPSNHRIGMVEMDKIVS